MEAGKLADSLDDIITSGKIAGKAKLITASFNDVDADQLRDGRQFKEKVDNAVIVFSHSSNRGQGIHDLRSK